MEITPKAMAIEYIRIKRFNPVSYTHLDVYKRQVKEDILSLVGATDFRIVAENGEGNEVAGQGICTSFSLNIPGREQPLGEVHLYSEHKMKKDDKALMRVITPYISWTLENGLTIARPKSFNNPFVKIMWEFANKNVR